MNNSNFASDVTKKGFINHIGGIDFKKVSENTLLLKKDLSITLVELILKKFQKTLLSLM